MTVRIFKSSPCGETLSEVFKYETAHTPSHTAANLVFPVELSCIYGEEGALFVGVS